jgi:hypothetical protein
MKYLMLLLILICIFSCGRNLKEAMRISKNFEREYTGLDTLIKIDGYYYHEDSIGLRSPFMILTMGKLSFFMYRDLKTILIYRNGLKTVNLKYLLKEAMHYMVIQ